MERLKRTFSMRKKRDTSIESNKPHQWQEDERKVREGSCSFQVKVWCYVLFTVGTSERCIVEFVIVI